MAQFTGYISLSISALQ